MKFQIVLSFVTFTGAFAQPAPLTSGGNQQGSVSFPELIAMMAMRNQLPVGDQQYTLLNLTDGRPMPTVPPTPVYPIQPPVQRQPRRPLQIQSLPYPFAKGNIQKAMPTAVKTAFPAAAQKAVQQALPSAVQSVVKAIPPAQPPPPQMSQADIQSAVQSAVSAALPSAVQSAVKAMKAINPVQQKPQIPQIDIESAVQSAINKALPSAIQSAVKPPVGKPPVKASTNSSPLDIQSLIQAAVNSAVKSTGSAGSGLSSAIAKPKNTGPPPACTGTCPPKWLTTVHGFTGVMKPGNPMCKYKKLMTPCDTPNSPCKTGYSCCPISCLQTIVHCHQGPEIQSACLPDDVTPWWPEMVQTYMQANGMGGGRMGGGMGGPMGGGLMGGLMGGGLAGMMGGLMGF